MAPLLFKGTLNGSVIELNLANKKDESATIKANIEYLQNLKYEQWSDLSVRERLELMQCCVDIECNYLGISDVKVVASNLADGALGSCDSRSESGERREWKSRGVVLLYRHQSKDDTDGTGRGFVGRKGSLLLNICDTTKECSKN